MLNDSENVIKFKMLNEFEIELDQIFSDYKNQIISYKECLTYIKNLISAWDYARLDIINSGNEFNTIEILDHNNLNISYPSWFEREDGKGCKVSSNSKDIKLLFNSNDDGKLKIHLRGTDYRNHENIRLPVYINYKSLKINGEFIFNENILIWHDTPYYYSADYDKTENINLSLCFETIHDYFPLLKILLTEIIDRDDLCRKYEKIKYYISYEKMLTRLYDLENDVQNAIINL